MADDVILPGTGEQIATDNVAGRQFQIVKLDLGGNGLTVPVVTAVPVTGPLTNTELRAVAVPVSGTVTASGPLTDTQLRATPVPVSGTVTASGPLTDTQLRAADVKITLDSETVVLGAGSAAFGKLAANSGVDIGDIDVTSCALPTGAATSALQTSGNTLLAGGLPAALAAGGGMKVEGVAGGVAQPMSAAQLPAALGQAAMAASLPVVVASDQAAIPTKASVISVPVTLTVTNGAYTAQDVVGGLITFANAVSANGGESVLTSLVLTGATAALALELWLFNADLATPLADNAPLAIVAADQPKVLGIFVMATQNAYQAGAGGVYCYSYPGAATQAPMNKQVKAAAGTRSIYAYIKHTATTSPGTTTLYLTASFQYLN